MSDNPRKEYPMFHGLMAYFPDALCEVARISKLGNDQHNPGERLHWAREKSADDEDAAIRHWKDRAKGFVFDDDGARHLAKASWRTLAALQKELERAAELEQAAEAAPIALYKDKKQGHVY